MITTLNTLFFWIAVVLSVLAIYNMFLSDRTELVKVRSFQMPDWAYWVAFGVFVILAVGIRVYRFGVVPGGMNQDGAMAAVDGKALAEYGTDRYGMYHPVHLTAWGYGQMSSLLSYLMVPFIRALGLSSLSARLPMLIVSLLGLVAMYVYVRMALEKYAALIVFAFLAVNPWQILQSRWALDCNLFPHFLLFGICFLTLALKVKKLRYLFFALSMVAFGLSMYCYGISIYTVPLFLLGTCIYLVIKKEMKLWEMGAAAVVYLLVAWPFILTMMVNTFGWDTIETALFTIPYFPNSVRSNDILFFSESPWMQLVENAKSLWAVTIKQSKDLPWNDVEGFGTMYLCSAPFFFVGLVSLFKNYRKNASAMLMFCFLLTGIWSGLVTDGVNVNRENIIYYAILFFIGFGIYETIRFSVFPKAYIAFGAAYLLLFGFFARTYFTDYANQMNYYFFGDFGNAVKTVKEVDADRYYITQDSQYQGARNVSEILTLFYMEVDAEYYQGSNYGPGSDEELPYYERYVYFSTGDAYGNPEENAAYVVTDNEIRNFDEAYYEITQFGSYYAVTLK